MSTDLVQSLKSVLRFLVPKSILMARYERYFFCTQRWQNLHLGVFDSFQAASEFASRRGVIPRFALDHEKWLQEHQGLSPHDYPMMFWLSRMLQEEEDMRVVDLGGSVGVTYYAYKPVMKFPAGLRWQVCELDDVVQLGRRIAQERGEPALSFTSDLKVLDGAPVLFAAGVIQYIEPRLVEVLSAVKYPPKHLLINRIPLTMDRATFVTLQNGGAGIQSYRIENHREFTDGLNRLGYREVDRWRCLENSTYIPFHPDVALNHFEGFYFVRDLNE
ncbi:methyltransferase, TIGR04325 family [Piscinibacter sp.]|uniref:methyltransferase, TIGR04325 family n=1 Tax=Piscinibacter sp. TaxID=1903157 RepID=UPI00355A2B19